MLPIESSGRNEYLHLRVQISFIHKSQKMGATQVYVDGGNHKQTVVYAQNGAQLSAKKLTEILTDATTQMNLEDLMLSEISQPQKARYYVMSLIQGA